MHEQKIRNKVITCYVILIGAYYWQHFQHIKVFLLLILWFINVNDIWQHYHVKAKFHTLRFRWHFTLIPAHDPCHLNCTCLFFLHSTDICELLLLAAVQYNDMLLRSKAMVDLGWIIITGLGKSSEKQCRIEKVSWNRSNPEITIIGDFINKTL